MRASSDMVDTVMFTANCKHCDWVFESDSIVVLTRKVRHHKDKHWRQTPAGRTYAASYYRRVFGYGN